jgi:hypothetical protein
VTEENKRVNIRAELDRAEQVKKSAELLFTHGQLTDAVSRLYYFVFHTLKALLLTEGLEPKSHEGALTLFGLHFIRTAKFAPEEAHIVSRLMKYRQEADYNPVYVFSQNDYVEMKRDAETLARKISDFLKAAGYL